MGLVFRSIQDSFSLGYLPFLQQTYKISHPTLTSFFHIKYILTHVYRGPSKSVTTMKINTDLYVKDVPGQLVSSLEPISSVDGNIVGVVHNREQTINGRIVVNVTFDIDPDRVDRLKKIWKSRDVIVAKLDSVVETFTMDYMLIGSLSASYIENLFNEASKEISLNSIDIGYSSKTANDTRTAMISVKVQKDDDLKKLDEFLSSACRKTGFIYIRGVGQ